MLVDDFTRADGRSALGTEWRYFADGVMGGVSRGGHVREALDGRPCIRLRGQVSLDFGGGFIQVALPLATPGGALDASAHEGVRLTVRGNGETYHVHLRTGDSARPQQYYRCAFEATDAWRDVTLPFADFTPERLSVPLDRGRLVRLGVVAARKAFTADVAVARIELR